MGRPLNKKYFGQGQDTDIKVEFQQGGTNYNGYIIKQLGTKKFRVRDSANSATFPKGTDCLLVAKDTDDLLDGEMSISVKDDNNNVLQVKKITANLIVDETGNSIKWGFDNYNAAGTEGVAEIEEESTDDFENDDANI